MCYLPGGGGSADPGPCAGDACGGSCWFAVLFGLSTVPSSAFMWSKGLAAKNLKAPRPMFAALSREKSWKHTQICQVTADLALETGPFAADSSQPLQAVKVANRRDALDSSRLYRYWSALRRLARIVEVAVAVLGAYQRVLKLMRSSKRRQDIARGGGRVDVNLGTPRC
jgi:hypothetical protein